MCLKINLWKICMDRNTINPLSIQLMFWTIYHLSAVSVSASFPPSVPFLSIYEHAPTYMKIMYMFLNIWEYNSCTIYFLLEYFIVYIFFNFQLQLTCSIILYIFYSSNPEVGSYLLDLFVPSHECLFPCYSYSCFWLIIQGWLKCPHRQKIFEHAHLLDHPLLSHDYLTTL